MLSAALQPGAQDGDAAESHWCGLKAVPEYLLAKVIGVIMGPCFPGSGLLGSFASVLVGPSEGHISSPGPLVPPPPTPGTAAGKSQHSPTVASFYMWALQEGPGSCSALAAVPPGWGCWKWQPSPRMTSFYFYATQAIRRALLPPQILVYCPSWAQLLSQSRPGVASFYHHDMQVIRGAWFLSEPLLCYSS